MNQSMIANTVFRGIRLSVTTALLALLASLLAITKPARAATYMVVNSNDNGPGSLRQAIDDANSNAGPDTITFAAATYGNPIVLSGAAGEDGNGSGDLDILDGGDLTIQGNGAAYTIIDGGGIDRVFHVCPGGGCNNTVTFIGVTIRKGSVVGGSGGGIRNEAGTTTLIGSIVSANTAMHGGGVWNYTTLNITDNSIIGGTGAGNTATWGGGVFNETGVTMIDSSSVSANSATYKGGGIYHKAGVTTVDGSSVSANTADYNGGGIYSKATLNVQNGSSIGGVGVGNQANSGGGIYNEYGITTVDGSAVSANRSTSNEDGGGGIYNEATLKVQNGSSIGVAGAGNNANSDGGGIYNNLGGITTVESSGISANTAYDAGGGIYSKATLNVQNGSSIGEFGAGNTATWGGGIYNEIGGTTMVYGSMVRANMAYDGGGIYSNNTLNVQNSSVGGAGAGNQANRSGGGIYNGNGTTAVNASNINNNTAEYGGGITNSATLNIQNGSSVGGAGVGNQATWGGGIYNETGGTTIVDSSSISANTAGHGGGIYSEATLSVQNSSTVGGAGAGNTADSAGGGIYIANGTTTVDGSTVSANTVITNDGGGIYNFIGMLNVQNGSIIGGLGVGNMADNGGGIYNEYGTTMVESSTVSANMADFGGGIFNNDGSTMTVDGSSVSANTAIYDGGGIFNRFTLVVQNGSIVGGSGTGNQASAGGGITNEVPGTTTVDDSIVSANAASFTGGGIENRSKLNIQNSSTVSANAASLTGGGIYNSGTMSVDGSTVSENTADFHGGGIFNGLGGRAMVTGSRILNNKATSNGGGVYNDRNAAGSTSVKSSCIVGNSTMSYFNDQPAQQIATGNWWGAATGPNSPGGDTVDGNVDVSGHLTASILGCASSTYLYLPVVRK